MKIQPAIISRNSDTPVITPVLGSFKLSLPHGGCIATFPRLPVYIMIDTTLPLPNNEDRGLGIDPRPLHFQHMTWLLDVTRQTLQPRPSGVLPKPWHAKQDRISGVAPRP